jgi:DNA-binding CsgD family transcriptional regulator
VLTAGQACQHAYGAPPLRAIALAGEIKRIREPLLLSVAPDGTGGPDLPNLWSSLVSGAFRILDFSRSEQHYRVALEEVRPGCRLPPPSPVDIETLERTLLGEAQKVIAIETGCSASTIASRTARCLKALGLACTTSAVPASLIMLLRAAKYELKTRYSVTELVGAGRTVLSVSMQRPEATFGGRLSTAERDVALLVADGCSHRDIARSRCASLRTVANQIASAYRKLGVSGRFELISYWLDGESISRGPRDA